MGSESTQSGKYEMSRYIDLEVYHAVERSHPFYIEMVDEMLTQINDLASENGSPTQLLEIGCGTGLLTEELAKNNRLAIDAVELDSNCFEIIHKNMNGRVNCICGDAVTYRGDKPYDIVTSAFAHDHIHYDLRQSFAENIRANLVKGGIYVMGGEILPFFETEDERKNSLYKYHEMIISKALRGGHFRLAQIEINALESGLHKVGDFKRHERMFEEEMMSADFVLKKKVKLGPDDDDRVGGVFTYVFEAV